MRISFPGIGLLLFCLVAVVACGPRVSDTGYTGTWQRPGINSVSTISIVEHGEGYLFRWGRTSTDNRLEVRCDWDGNCEEKFDGERAATYKLRTWVDDESGRLHVECNGTRFDQPDGELEVHYVDELMVVREGKRLVSRVVEQDHKKLKRRGSGRRIFEKTSDSVVAPPARSVGRG